MSRAPTLRRLDEDTVRQLIDLARRLEQVSKGLRDALDGGGRRREALDMYFESPTRRALLTRFRSLSPPERDELVALMWLGEDGAGRTRFDWPSLLDEARKTPGDTDALELIDCNRLSDYLETGLDKLAPVRTV